MRTAALRLVVILLAFSGGFGQCYAQGRTRQIAVAAMVSGENIQKVGFRAMVQNLAIQYNLAGFVTNGLEGKVEVRLEGAKERVKFVIDAMRRGSKKSSHDNKVLQSPAEPTAGLDTFTIYGWTSASRKITTPYDLVFRLRPDGRTITRMAAKEVWNAIVLAALKGDDLAKFKLRLEADE